MLDVPFTMLTQLSSHHYHTLKVWYLVQHSLVSFKKLLIILEIVKKPLNLMV